jgi:hypothetical protein
MIVYSSCVDLKKDSTDIEAKDLLGSWKVDSVDKPKSNKGHSIIEAVEFSKDRVTWYAFKERLNRVFKNETEQGFKVENSIIDFLYDSIRISTVADEGRFLVESMGKDRIKFSALFATSTLLYHQDSVIWYSRIENADEYLRSFIDSSRVIVHACDSIDISQIKGYWSVDSTVNLNSTQIEKDRFFHFDGQDHMYVFNQKRNKPRKFVYEIKDHILIMESDSVPILCLDSQQLILGDDKINYFFAVYLSRVNQEIITQDSLIID